MRYVLLTLSFLLLFTSSPSNAYAAIVAGETCTQLGESTMLTDQTGIAVCAREAAGSEKLIWKSMSGGGSNGSLCGMATKLCLHTSDNCTLKPVATCNGEDLVIFTKNKYGNITSSTTHCPTGYNMSGWTSPAVPINNGSGDGGLNSSMWAYFYSCVKN